MHIEFSSVTISFFVHATEDLELVLHDLSSVFDLGDEEITKETMAGHFGNSIIFVKAHITGNRAQQVAGLLMMKLTDLARSRIIAELEKSMDEHDSLYLRIDRQSLKNTLEIGDDEPVRVKLKPKSRLPDRRVMKMAYTELIK